jgi:hypothetical protein
MMRHLLMDPAFPDIVGQAAVEGNQWPDSCANDNGGAEDGSELSDPLLAKLAELEVAATRLW